MRPSFVVESVRRLLVAESHQEVLEPEQEHAIQQLRELDAWHLCLQNRCRRNPSGGNSHRDCRELPRLCGSTFLTSM